MAVPAAMTAPPAALGAPRSDGVGPCKAHFGGQSWGAGALSVELVHGLHRRDDVLRRGVGDLPGQEELVQDVVHLVKVEDEVQFAHISEVAVEDLHEQVDQLQGAQLVVVDVHAEDEEHAGIPPIDDLVVPVLQEISVPGVPRHDGPVDLRLDLELFAGVEGDVPLRQSGLPLAILQEDEADHPAGPRCRQPRVARPTRDPRAQRGAGRGIGRDA
eukprot:CAMPEP_0176223902 /NCGR_PEP_ID=MMETSP0121_2-20121125/20982_1 /TAXON_ID=160619 /ORGANISM="Kryptoperidinium foliaceum, Strain CCMP 1326" /LENGTH=214 /DNA_ID=CAMNT_0017563147 /DNA_START=30 /DNA_END=671 /DNA_ORIENTATION=+